MKTKTGEDFIGTRFRLTELAFRGEGPKRVCAVPPPGPGGVEFKPGDEFTLDQGDFRLALHPEVHIASGVWEVVKPKPVVKAKGKPREVADGS